MESESNSIQFLQNLRRENMRRSYILLNSSSMTYDRYFDIATAIFQKTKNVRIYNGDENEYDKLSCSFM